MHIQQHCACNTKQYSTPASPTQQYKAILYPRLSHPTIQSNTLPRLSHPTIQSNTLPPPLTPINTLVHFICTSGTIIYVSFQMFRRWPWGELSFNSDKQKKKKKNIASKHAKIVYPPHTHMSPVLRLLRSWSRRGSKVVILYHNVVWIRSDKNRNKMIVFVFPDMV
jgi:hypothetical protein